MNNLTNIERANRASRVLRNFLDDKRARQRFGARVRQSVLEQIQAGQEVDNYRIRWLEATAHRVTDLLNLASQEFEGRYPWDCSSKFDLIDILKHVANHIEGDADE